MSLVEPMLAELEQESVGTRRLLERVPMAHAAWKPHAKSMTLGALASHIAETPGWAEQILGLDVFDVNLADYKPWVATSVEELRAKFDEGMAIARSAMQGVTDERMLATWKMVTEGRVIVEGRRIQVLRGFVISHLIHHRGQLTVYLRLKDVPLPSIYGPSADEHSSFG